VKIYDDNIVTLKRLNLSHSNTNIFGVVVYMMYCIFLNIVKIQKKCVILLTGNIRIFFHFFNFEISVVRIKEYFYCFDVRIQSMVHAQR